MNFIDEVFDFVYKKSNLENELDLLKVDDLLDALVLSAIRLLVEECKKKGMDKKTLEIYVKTYLRNILNAYFEDENLIPKMINSNVNKDHEDIYNKYI